MWIEVRMLWGEESELRCSRTSEEGSSRVGIFARSAVVRVDVGNCKAGGRPVALEEAEDVGGSAFVEGVGGAELRREGVALDKCTVMDRSGEEGGAADSAKFGRVSEGFAKDTE